ncbi:MAG: hypothetical protein WCY56_03050 [Aminobacteriaceae bacterium]
MVATDLEEAALAHLVPGLRRGVHLLEALDSLGGHVAVAWGDVRVLGGNHAAQAERRAELLEELEAMPLKLVKVARKIRDNPPDSQRGRYVAGLLRGLSGEDLRRAARLSDRKIEDCRRWLKSIMAACR